MLTPAEHYEEADRLLTRAAEMEAPTLPISRALVAQAQAHATLAQCGDLFPEHVCIDYAYRVHPGLATPELKGDVL